MASRVDCAVLGAALLLTVTGCDAAPGPPFSPSPAETPLGFRNSVYDGNFPDPMIADGGSGLYWAFATNGNGENVQTLRSADLISWQHGSDALPQLPSWSAPGKVWAPEVGRSGDTWLLYYTTRAPDPEIQCIGVATATRVEGPYVDSHDHPLVCEEDHGGSIDAHPFTDVDGNRYLYWKNDGNAVGVDTWISVQRLDPSGTKLVGKPKQLIKQDQTWEGDVVEAPFVWQVDGTYWLFYSANFYASADYAVGVARSDSPLGPFTKLADPVLNSNDVAAGPGHCALFERNGKVWMAYHAWAPDAIGSEEAGRTLWLSEVRFDGDTVRIEPPRTDYPVRP